MVAISSSTGFVHHLNYEAFARILSSLPANAVLYANDASEFPALGLYASLQFPKDIELESGAVPMTVGEYYRHLRDLADTKVVTRFGVDTGQRLSPSSLVWMRGKSLKAVNGVRINGDGSYTLSMFSLSGQ